MPQNTPASLPPYLHTYRAQGHTVLELHGEIDLAATLEITPQLDTATALPELLVIIDLTPVTFFDCSGLRLLCRAHFRITALHGNLQLVCPHPLTLRVLRITRLSHIFHPVPTLGEALHHHAHRCAGQRSTERQETGPNSPQGSGHTTACPIATSPLPAAPSPQQTQNRPAA
ncbi:STAS domain-containing protein [Streptomyces melanogenes]|uniref:STAS domain-containing protein n=1 Tax=Streptomyces melanogenes TaxID=67326 RepID=UPI002E34AD46|nr:STAS domain-containing protein [Streptomyces melanogenes]